MNPQPVKQRVMDILGTIEGMKRVGEQTTQAIREIPSAFVFTGQGTYTYDEASDLLRIERTYRIVVLVYPLEVGKELEGEKRTLEWYDKIHMAFLTRPMLSDRVFSPLPYVLSATLTGDSGFTVIEAGAPYAGLEFTLSVMTLHNKKPQAV